MTTAAVDVRAAPKARARAKSPALRWRAMVRVGLRMMVHDKLKMIGTLVGVVFAVLLSNQQAGTFMGLLKKNTMFIDNAQADLWIMPPNTETLVAGKPIPEAISKQARGIEGVAWAEPLLFGGGQIALPGGAAEGVTIVGTRLPALKGGPWNMVVGDPGVLAHPDTMIFEDGVRDTLGGLNLGSVREVNGRNVQVGGFTWGLLPFGPAYAFAEYDLARLLLHVDADRAHRARHTAAADRQTTRAAEVRARAAQAGSRGEDILAARAAVVAAKARLDQAKATLERRQIRAPHAGEVLQVKARAGEYYTPGASEAPVVLGDTSRLRVRMDVDERDIGRVQLGQRAYAVADAHPGVRFTGKVSEIGRRMGRKNVRSDDPTERIDTKILEVMIDLDEAQKLVPGLRVTSYIKAGK